MSSFEIILIQFAILAYTLVCGVFLAFSDFIMRSLSISGTVEAMQAINREVFRWIFMSLFLGMAAGSVLLTAYALVALSGIEATLIALSGLVYLFGCFAVTVFRNVPLNEALAKMDGREAEAQIYWEEVYLPRWTAWNTVRALACGASAILLLQGLLNIVRAPV
jgi:uncharacterized membrane protein